MLEYLCYAFGNIDIDFVVELMAAEAIFLWRAPRRKLFVLRLLPSVVICVLASILWNNGSVGVDDGASFVISALRYLFLFALTLAAVAFCFRLSFADLVFYGTGAYAAQHGAFSIRIMLLTIIMSSTGGSVLANLSSAVSRIISLAVFAAVYVAVYFVFVRRIAGTEGGKGRLKVLLPSSILVLTSVVINLHWFRDGMLDAINQLYPIVCCIMALLILSGSFENSRLQDENAVINAMLEMKKEHADLYKENIAIINTKCHDLKHQLAALLHSHDGLREYAEEAVERINIYDSIAKTGNEALDVVLTEKSLQCEANGIKFTYMADGSSIAFMSASDVYSLFGNALDNAISSVKKITEPDRRMIEMNAFSSGNVATVHFGNYYDGEIIFENGLPRTTKQDRSYHGFGVKSIMYIAKKYGGSMTVSAEDGIFNLNVIMPIPAASSDISGHGSGIS